MKLNILSWNVSGLGNGRRECKVKKKLRDVGADLVCLQESKLSRVDKAIICC